MKIPISPREFIIVLVLFIIGVISLAIYSLHDMDKEHSRSYAITVEEIAINTLRKIYNAEEDFKIERINDKNNNGIGEYATTSKLAEYIRGDKEKFKLIGIFAIYDKEHDLVRRSGYRYRIFLPAQLYLQEQRWGCLALPDPNSNIGFGRSYYLDEKGIIFFTEKGSLGKPKDEWTLKKVFWGEPFKSPLNTSIWKILDKQ